MNRETPHVVFTAHRAELYLDPRQVLRKDHCGQLGESSPLLAQFGTERSDRTTACSALRLATDRRIDSSPVVGLRSRQLGRSSDGWQIVGK